MTVYNPSPINDCFLHLIGLIACQWSWIEVQMEFAILRNQEIEPNVGMVITAQLDGRAELELLRALNEEGAFEPTSAKEDVAKLLKRIDNAHARRNEAVHHAWMSTTDPDVATRKSVLSRGRLKVVDESVHIGQLETIARHITQTGTDFYDFMGKQGLWPEHGI